MQYRRIGSVTVSAIGLGGMPLSIEGRPDEARAIATVHAALDAGITFIDTAMSYCLDSSETGHNESLIARALAAYGGDTSGVLVGTKGGAARGATGEWSFHGDPATLREACEGSLKRLGVDSIGLYQLHVPDPDVPYAESVGALGELHDAGKIRAVGISNVSSGQLREAHGILGERLVSVQNNFSPAVRESEPQLRLCEELGIAFLPYSPLGGISRAGGLGSAHAAFARIAESRGVSPQQVCLAWELAKSPVVVPIPGSSRPATITASAAAADLELTAAELAELDAGQGVS
ncbi:aldo/keto reductase [Streptomyces antnestii]|uniref:Aldo/keto reductase n=1 Tax=Streptomyces antnestii TaxID=2494256 RepID=A0A437Q031_9ACTN|nr:aldo/keto reductase [Streptomyces sp. San01]RVU27853.1 aldo/keto reductase [Streptomyces sp. San01]